MLDACGPVPLQPSQQKAYAKALLLVVEAHDRLGNVKTAGWTQSTVLSGVFEQLEEAAEALIELNPNAVSKQLRGAVKRWTAE